jgi:AcrR family transcriptional regulator
MAVAKPPEVARRGRPRSEDVDQAILAAAISILFERGLGAMTIEDVSARAGVGKASIYRRWSSKGTLALDAFQQSYLIEQPITDHGDFEQDLRATLRSWAHAVVGTPTGRVLEQLIAEAQLDEGLAREWTSRVIVPSRNRSRVMVERAILRGEIPADSDADVLMDLLYGTAFHRLLQGHLGISTDFIDRVAHYVAEGAKAGAAKVEKK